MKPINRSLRLAAVICFLFAIAACAAPFVPDSAIGNIEQVHTKKSPVGATPGAASSKSETKSVQDVLRDFDTQAPAEPEPRKTKGRKYKMAFLRVSTAGDVNFRGDYTLVDTSNGKVRYSKARGPGFDKCEWDGGRWVIWNQYQIDYYNNSSSSTPPPTGWLVEDGTGPAPTTEIIESGGGANTKRSFMVN